MNGFTWPPGGRVSPRTLGLLAVPLLAAFVAACSGGSDSDTTSTSTVQLGTPAVPEASATPARLPGPGPSIVIVTPEPTAVQPVNGAIPSQTPAPASATARPLSSPRPGSPVALEATPGASLPTVVVVGPGSPSPTPVDLATPTPTVRPIDTATPTPTPVAVPTPTRTPIPTPVPSPTSTPIPAPQPTPEATSTPIPPSDRFGVISGGSGAGYRLETLGIDWYIQFNADPASTPPGTLKVPFVSVKPGKARLTPGEIAEFTTAAPGRTWYIGGEPNVPQQDGISPEAYVDELDYYATAIRSADPSAKIMGPSILNWDFTCSGCNGFQSGESWMRQFVNAYVIAHGTYPPVDVWAIDTYPLTWDSVPMANWQIVRDQIIGFRQFLIDEVPGHANTPIWITEIASHWGYSAWEIKDNVFAVPEGLEFQWSDMVAYMDGILDWLEDNATAQKIERWFFFIDWIDITTSASDGYAGIHFFESGNVGAPLNQLGEVYRDHALGLR